MTKEELRDYIPLKGEREQIQRLLEEVESRIYSPKVPVLTGMPSAPSPSGGSGQEKQADKTLELRDLYRTKLQDIDRQMVAVENAIAELEPTMRLLLRHRYIEGLTWEEISEAMNYGLTSIHRLHGQALQQLRG